MKTTLLIIASLGVNAYASEPALTMQAQPLARSATTPASVKNQAAGKAVLSPKIHETVATRNNDGTLNIGCAERPNPRAGRPPINTISPEPQQ